MPAIRRAAAMALAVALLGCGPTAPTPPAAAPSSQTPAAAASAAVTAATGGTVSVPDGPALAVPPGGVAADTTATIRAASDGAPAWTGSSPATAVGPAWEIDLGGAPLRGEATLTLRVNPASLPDGASALGLLLAYLDPETKAWVPVPARVDPTGTVTASVSHLSVWQIFSLALGLPFAAGTSVSIGPKGLHAANFGSVPGGPSGAIAIAGQDSVAASIDLVVPQAGVEVRPVAAGTVISAWPECTVAVVDHGGGLWSAYVHIDVTAKAGDTVDPSKAIGFVLPKPAADWVPPAQCGALESTAPHVHLAFARGIGSSGATGEYMPLLGATLCQHVVTGTGDLAGLGSVGGSLFAVPSCAGNAAGGSTPSLPPTPPPVLSGAWVAPAQGATVKAAKVRLSASASSRLADARVTRVAFSVATGSGAPVRACEAKQADAGGVWSCDVPDLWALGAQPGPLTLRFDVFDGVGDMTPDAGGARTVTFGAPSPEPTKVRFSSTPIAGEWQMETAKVTWAEVDATSTIWVYGVTKCTIDPGETGASAGKPCVAQGMRIPNASMVAIAKVPAAKGSYSWRSGMGAGPWVASAKTGGVWSDFWSVVLIARNAAGYTHFVVAATAQAPCAGCGY